MWVLYLIATNAMTIQYLALKMRYQLTLWTKNLKKRIKRQTRSFALEILEEMEMREVAVSQSLYKSVFLKLIEKVFLKNGKNVRLQRCDLKTIRHVF